MSITIWAVHWIVRLDNQEAIAAEVAAGEQTERSAGTIDWTFTLAAARQKLRKLYPSNEDG